MKSLSTRIHQLIFLIALLVFISCGSDEEIVYPEGGYPYPSNITAADSNFYFLPIQKIVSRRDSIMIRNYKSIYSAFNETNLSIAAPREDIFRFAYECSFIGEWAIITLTKDKIVIKAKKSGSPVRAPNEEALDSIERMHFNLLESKYPLTEAKFSEWRKRYVDSLIKVYPQLLDPAYYLKLINKFYSVYQGPFEYTKKEIRISTDKYKYIVSPINNSEYWKRPFYKEDCSIMDGSGFFLEAIIKKKYQNTMFTLCPNDSSNLRKAYDEVLKYAGIEYGKLGREDTTTIMPARKVQIREVQLQELKPEPKKKK